MALQWTPFTLPILAAGLGYAAFAVYLFRRPEHRGTHGSRIAAFLLGGMAVWLLAYAGQLSVTSLDAKLVFQRLKYLGPTTVPVLWFAYTLAYTGYVDAVPRRAWAALAVPPAAMFALAVTYPLNRLVWADAFRRDLGNWVGLGVEHAVAFYGYQVYVYGLFLASLFVLAQNLVASSGVYRRQTLGLLAGALLPGFLGVLHVADASPVPYLDLPAIAFVGTAAAVAWSATRDDLFTLEPVAWETAIAKLDDPVFVLDTDDRVVAANDAAESFAPDPVGQSAAATLGRVLADDVWTAVGDHECDGTSGCRHRVYEVSVSPVERDQTRVGRVVVVRDVTERRERERRLDEFASVVSHDLRNPLNVAHGHLELARESGDDEHFEETDDALARMEDIIDDLLTLAREGDATPDAEPVTLSAAARTAWESVEATDADATLEVGEDRTLVADETALVRLLENLFRNSTEHAGCDVAVAVGTTGGGFYVEDDGPGVPESERDTVFESGFTTRDDGTGFGLSIVAEVADSHGWTVALVDGEAGGARFEFDT
ncbi:sensor histidine kinase [Halobacterium rubrum]|uniref:sensor histidine kinase n=1 Tax=Halobacterium TaxID=2239 RepID=UPI001F38BDBE|nr:MULTISPECIES: histidine kinase N-terminal 7TM domain-containing protein [Halobacterium]MDH5019435.1 histidine kinase N-terminal 7TM domain-containing protein [Halobacterium rubrum]